MKKWFTIAEADKETGVPHQTLRRYLANHSHHLLMKKKHKSYLVAEESIPTLKKIRELYSDGKTIEEVDSILANMGIPMNVTIEDDEKQVSINIGESLLQLQQDMKEQKEFNEKLLRVVHEQNEKLAEQQKYIATSLEKRDGDLMRALRETMETQKLIAASEEKKWWEFWKR
jgi:DNA-binding transcriptional MerR regulator